MIVRKGLLSAFSAAALMASAPQVGSAQDQDSAGGLDEIVVTARKRAEDILQTPVAVSVVTGADIDAKGIVSLTDLANNTPGLQITSVNSGRNDRSFQQISLRGMTPSRTSSTLTATFIDGVPVSSANALNSVTRPERVEVLKGPQAAYFGRNAFAGAVNVVNKEPGEEFGGDLSIMGGSRSNWDVQASLEGPLFSDKVGFRLSARSYSKEGSYDNGGVPGQTLGDQSTDVFSLMLAAQPTEGLKIKFFGMMTQDDDGPSPEGMVSAYEIRSNAGVLNIPFNSGSTAGTVVVPGRSNCTPNGRPWFCGAIPALLPDFGPAQNSANNAISTASTASSNRRIIDASDGVRGYGLVGEFKHAHLTIDWDIGDSGFTLSSLSGINDYFVSETDDLDNWDSSSIINTFNPTGANPNANTFWSFPFMVEREERDFSQEFRLQYDNDGPFSGLLGVSYLKTSAWSDLVNLFNEYTVGLPASARAASSVTAPPKAETTSIFFGATYEVTDKLTISAEGRQQKDEVESYTGGTTVTISPAAATQYGLAAGAYAPFTLLVAREFDHFLPRVIVDYQFNDDLMGYVSWSKGVNVALLSFNTNFLVLGSPEVLAAADAIGLGVFIEPEEIENWEIGLKGSLFDDRVRGALAIYRADWTEQQNSRSTFVVDGMGVPQIVTGVANTGRVIATGIELDLIAKPSDAFTVQFSAAMNDSDIKSFEDPLITGITGVVGDGFRGNNMPLAPKYSANLGVQYDGVLPLWDEASWFARADVSYKGKQYIDTSNINWINDRTQVNVRAGFTRGPVSVDAFVLNLFDNDDYISAAQNSLLTPDFSLTAAGVGYINAALPERRVVGLKVGYKF
jgi:iron complex outermembrane recepter protein